MFTDISLGRTEHRWVKEWENNIKHRRAMNLLSRKFIIFFFKCTSLLHFWQMEKLEISVWQAVFTLRNWNKHCQQLMAWGGRMEKHFFQKQKPLIIPNVDEPQQSTEILRRKAEQALVFLIRVVGHLISGSILTFSVFYCTSSCLNFSYDKCSFDSLHWISL